MRLLARASLFVASLLVGAGSAGLALTACFSDDSLATTDGGDAGADAADVMSADTASEPMPCTPYVSDAGLMSPTVTYSKDVAPIFDLSCAVGGANCHGDVSVKNLGRPFLGLRDGGVDAASLIAGIVGVKSVEDPSMNEITAGDPKQSFLMHKMDADQGCFAADCANNGTPYTDCGGLMPSLNPILDQPTRDTVRRWIAQGAQAN